MQNFGKFKKISAQITENAEQNTKVRPSISKTKRNAYLIMLAKHRKEVRKIENEND